MARPVNINPFLNYELYSGNSHNRCMGIIDTTLSMNRPCKSDRLPARPSCFEYPRPARASFPVRRGTSGIKILRSVIPPHLALQHLYGSDMTLDVEKYRHYLAGYEMSEEDKTELIQSVWAILEGFVDHAFGQHPIQQCGRTLEHSDLQSRSESLESAEDHPLKKKKPIRYEDLKRIGPP